MTDVSSDPSSGSRRAREAARRSGSRNVARRVGYAVLFIVVLVLLSLVATDTIAIRGKRPHLKKSAIASASSGAAGNYADEHDIRALDAVSTVRPLTHDAPLRVWMGGDSHVGNVGRHLGEMLQDTGVVTTQIDYRVGSGLMSGSRDWPTYAPAQLLRYNPEVVVFMVGTNDAVTFSRAREGEYRLRVARMMDLLGGDGTRTIYWVGTPPLRNERWESNRIQVNRIMRDEAHRRSSVVYVDLDRVVAAPDGGFADLIERDGKTVRIRVGDGIHFTEAGADLVGAVLFIVMDQRYQMGEQADPDRPIAFHFTQGSGCTGSCGARRSYSPSATTAPTSTPSVRSPSSTTTSVPTATTAPAETTAPVVTAPTETTAVVPTTAADEGCQGLLCF
jgi:hypothetical protein